MKLDNILTEFDFDKNSEHYIKISTIPKKGEIEALVFLFNLPDFHPSMVDPNIKDIVFGIDTELNEPEIKDSMLDTYFYALGAQLFELSIARKIDSKNIHTSKQLFEWSIAIDSKYYQAYNRLGDCHMVIRENYKTAISCFKYSLEFLGSGGKNDISMFAGVEDTLKGDNYLKIGLALIYLNRKDDAKIFILKAKEILDEDYLRVGFNLKYSTWTEIMELLENYDSGQVVREKEDDEKNKKIILDKIQEAVELKRVGNFDDANSLYLDLNNKYTNNPIIIYSWAKILVCMQEYDKAVEKFTIASKLFQNIGNSQYYQSDEHIETIQNRFEDSENFKSWVSRISGGSVEPNNVNL